MTHAEKVRRVVEMVKAMPASERGFSIHKDSEPHFCPNPHEQEVPRIDLRSLIGLLEIYVQNRTATAESGITFDDLTRETLKHGLIPKTVPELRGITIGGAVAGCSVESMSYKFGGFHDSVLEYEAVSGDGEVITCSRTEDEEIFHMLHGTYGTLALITRVTFELVPAKPFVELEYRLHTDFATYWQDLQERCAKDDYDFVDGIIHRPDALVLVLGRMVDTGTEITRYDGANIYYRNTLHHRREVVPIHDYFFRYDRDCHWMTKTVPPLEWRPIRKLVGPWLLGSTNMIKWSRRLKPFYKMQRRPDVVVDVFVPARNFPTFWEWYRDVFEFWPLWIVPYNAPEMYPWIDADYKKDRMQETFLIDCAVYGKANNDPDIDWSEELQRKTHELGGFKTLISRNHYDRDDFWSVFNRPHWTALKGRLDPRNVLGDLYERFSPEMSGASRAG